MVTGKFFETVFALFTRVCGIILFGSVGIIIVYLVYHGAPAISFELIFGNVSPMDAILMKRQVFNGIFPAIAGTVTLVCISVGIAVPIGLATGIYMAEYADSRIKSLFSLFYDILASVPSILVGLFGFSVAVWLHHTFQGKIFPCLLVSSFSLAFLVLPYIIRTTETSLENLPSELRLTAVALGASRQQNIFRVLLPCASSGILSGIILAIGRCAEDTAVIMLTGVVASAGIPKSLMGSYEALPFYIYYISSQYMDRSELATGYSAALILLGVCLSLFLVSWLIKYYLQKRFLAVSHRL